MLLSSKKPISFFVAALFLAPSISFAAAAKLEYSAWIPYWRKASGTAETLSHIKTFSEVSPFSYSVKPDGTLVDTMKITNEPWKAFMSEAKAKKVKVVPSILWTDADAMHSVLKTYTLRIAHEKAIMKAVTDGGFDGIDLDYEGKKAETKKYFSYFLQELSGMLHKKGKILVCTIEPRTPLDSRFQVIPTDIAYANDYAALNAYCDRVRIMTYDQMTVDLLLRAERGNLALYAPVADTAWVKKVASLASRTIKPSKIVLGVPTYGYEYRVTRKGTKYEYERLRAINHSDAVALAVKTGAFPFRNLAGEMSFTYVSSNDFSSTTSTTTRSSAPFRLVWWSDAKSLSEKVSLAKSLGLRGIAIFKIDGGHDPKVWDAMK